ncbi:MAG TPA: polysaccharide deacetylase family protein [Methylomirabilota bacterium]|jgi:peptidoglycan/xylan/chitin deacetylase (PgdA/CDA1 family)|nr:polysaccharide deacetylase family protein [Methylomirabilota bacterium]
MTAALWWLAAPVVWGAYTLGSQALALGAVRRGRRQGRLAALTFDDGPDPVQTPRVLDILAREGVQATFFLIGQRAAALPDIARRIASLGHDVGNHTWSHANLWLCGPRRTEREIVQGHEAIAAASGRAPRCFRAPWGMTNLAVWSVLRRFNTPCIFWTVQPEGRRPVAPALQLRRMTERVQPGAIVDLHDADGVPGAGRRLVEALPAAIAALRERGYTLAPLRDLL